MAEEEGFRIHVYNAAVIYKILMDLSFFEPKIEIEFQTNEPTLCVMNVRHYVGRFSPSVDITCEEGKFPVLSFLGLRIGKFKDVTMMTNRVRKLLNLELNTRETHHWNKVQKSLKP